MYLPDFMLVSSNTYLLPTHFGNLNKYHLFAHIICPYVSSKFLFLYTFAVPAVSANKHTKLFAYPLVIFAPETFSDRKFSASDIKRNYLYFIKDTAREELVGMVERLLHMTEAAAKAHTFSSYTSAIAAFQTESFPTREGYLFVVTAMAELVCIHKPSDSRYGLLYDLSTDETFSICGRNAFYSFNNVCSEHFNNVPLVCTAFHSSWSD